MMDRVVGDVLREQAQADGDAPFLKCSGDWLTLGDVDRSSDAVAGALAAIGVVHGDRVAILLPNSDMLVSLIFGAAKSGAIQVPLNYWLKGSFLTYQLADCGATVLITDSAGFASAVPLLPDTEVRSVVVIEDVDATSWGKLQVLHIDELLNDAPTAPSVNLDLGHLVSLSYTSGTTGYPKGCMLSHGYYTAIPRTYRDAQFFLPGDRLFSAFPMFHMSGVMSFMNPLVNGGSAAFDLGFSASSYMATAKAAGATVLWGVGSMGMAILSTPVGEADKDYGFRLAMFVPMHPAKQIEFEERFSTRVTSELFGQTECSPTTIGPVDATPRRDSAGTAGSHVDVRIVDDLDREVEPGTVGEIVVRPIEPYVMYSGYWNKGDETVETWRNFWHHTGDYGRQDDDGYVYFVDRKKDCLRRRGENVPSLELEMSITRHPAVAAAAVCGVPSPLGEDDIKVSMILEPNASVTPDELFDYFKSNLPYFAIPRFVEIRDELPSTTMGKVQKHLLRDEGVTEGMWDLEALGLVVTKSERR